MLVRPPAAEASAGSIPSAPAGGPPDPPVRLTVEDADGPRATVAPRLAGIAHVILAVEDDGSPALTSYRRVILHLSPALDADREPLADPCHPRDEVVISAVRTCAGARGAAGCRPADAAPGDVRGARRPAVSRHRSFEGRPSSGRPLPSPALAPGIPRARDRPGAGRHAPAHCEDLAGPGIAARRPGGSTGRRTPAARASRLAPSVPPADPRGFNRRPLSPAQRPRSRSPPCSRKSRSACSRPASASARTARKAGSPRRPSKAGAVASVGATV